MPRARSTGAQLAVDAGEMGVYPSYTWQTQKQ